MTTPAVSVVVPTRNRAESVLRLLQALAREGPVDGGFEVVVVADGCSDRTGERIAARQWDFEVHLIDLAPSGPAIARNCGAALARGGLLLFLDDDVEPEAGTVAAHLAFHRLHPRNVAIGYLPTVARGTGLFPMTLRGWWESMFDGPRRPGHRYSYRNLLSGHFSIAREQFDALGGFRRELSCHEDWEFGYRAIRAGLQIAFVPAAIAWHHDETDLAKSLRRKFDEGIADVRLARLYPELTLTLPLGWTPPGELNNSRMIDLAFNRPAVGDRLFGALERLLPFYERWRLRFRWRDVLERAMKYRYWRGVAHEAGSRDELASLLRGAPPPAEPEFVIDLADGLSSAFARVDDHRPSSARVLYRGRPVGNIPAQPGAEPLRSVHVREALAGVLAPRLAWALAQEQELPPILAATVRDNPALTESAGARSAAAFAA
jgi:GT2 family glycosyltransferase